MAAPISRLLIAPTASKQARQSPLVNSKTVHHNHEKFSRLYYKPMMSVNDDPRVVNKLEASLTDDARVVIYDRHMFIVQATDDPPI